MMKNQRYLTLACVLTLALAAGASAVVRRASARSVEGEAYAIRGGTVVTVTGATIPKGVVIIRDGLIVAVGVDVPVPADARVIDATGMTVYPGLIDSYTSLGLQTAATPAPAGRGAARVAVAIPAATTPQTTTPPSSGLKPEVMAADEIKVTAETFDTPRSAGITTALTSPNSGIFQGQSALINLGDGEPEKLILKSPATLNVTFTSARGGVYPTSLMGVFSFLRQSLLDAQHYREEWDRYNRNKRGVTRPQVDKSLAALQPVLSGELPVVFRANTEREIKRAIELGEEFKLKYLIAGGAQSYEIADWLKQKKATVLLSLNYPQRPTDIEDPESESLRTLRERADAPKAAAALSKAGVRFALQSGYLVRPQDFIANAARAIEAGLAKEEAIKALTIYPAQIFGVAEQLGSIEKGKIANLVVTSGDLFDRRTQVKYVFVDGKQYDVKAPTQAGPPGRGGFGGRPGGPGARPNAAEGAGATGVWSITTDSPQGPLQQTLTLRQDGDSLSGEIESPFGKFPVTGRASGNEVTFDFTANIQDRQMPVSGRGTIEGNSIRGTLSIHGQNFEFTGTRTPR